MGFKTTVATVTALRDHYREGLQALSGVDRGRIRVATARRLTGSVCVEGALRHSCPNEPLWDYGIGHRGTGGDHAIWIEVHPASSHHVAPMIAKVRWLRNWLCQHAPALLRMTRDREGFVWLSSGGVSLQRGSRQARQLAMAGVSFPRKILNLP